MESTEPLNLPRVQFSDIIAGFNKMYRMPVAPYPSMNHLGQSCRERIQQFMRAIAKEVDEGHAILALLDEHQKNCAKEISSVEGLQWSREESELEILTEIADWLGDLIVYSASEMVKYGLPMNPVLEVIMESNTSKLQPDGTAEFIDGKLQKGPNYWRPESVIKELLRNRIPQ